MQVGVPENVVNIHAALDRKKKFERKNK